MKPSSKRARFFNGFKVIDGKVIELGHNLAKLTALALDRDTN